MPSINGQEYYRSIEHLANSPEVQQCIEREFPELAENIDSNSRRQFLQLLGGSLALAGITSTGCRRWPVEEVRPHSARPEGFLPGVAEHYATSIEVDGVATSVLVKSFDGRPIKVEGNPEHPFSSGAADAQAQATVLELYDPDRSRTVVHRDSTQREKTWDDFHAFAGPHFHAIRSRQGEGLALLTQPSDGPTLHRLREDLLAELPEARWFEYHPIHRDFEQTASVAAFGGSLRPQFQLSQASVILSFDADLLGSHPAHLKHSRDWATGRRSVDRGHMNRLISIESGWSITGSVADIRLPLKPSSVELAVAYVAQALGVMPAFPVGLNETERRILDAATADLKQAGPNGLVIAGPAQSSETHRLVYAINAQLGCVGTCVAYVDDNSGVRSGCVEQIEELSELLQGNVINTVVILGGNPVYDGPADLPLKLTSDESGQLTSIHLSLHDNETSRECTWHIPAAHYLECWGDGRAWDGTYTLQQPLILPLYEGKSPIEFLSSLSGQRAANGMSLVRKTFDGLFTNSTQQDWELALHAGLKTDSGYVVQKVTGDAKALAPNVAELSSTQSVGDHKWEVRFAGDTKIHDGRFANNAWLQELPEPLTKLTWDNAAIVSPEDAASEGWSNGDIIRIAFDDSSVIEIAVYIMPGHAQACITLPLGYGRLCAGHIGNGVGVNVYPLRRAGSSYVAKDCEITKTGERHQLVSTQEHHLLDAVAERAKTLRLGERNEPGMLVHELTFAEFVNDPHSLHGEVHAAHEAPLFDLPHKFNSPHKWGMSIDLNACLGCSGCVVACQAENNIPVVGKANVAVNREMHWLRIDRYFKGSVSQPDVVHIPTACVHCENAPCEQVCPVAATVHDSEGLNAMVYNRCIGTRYCANNCPFKTRRFNYFDYQASDPHSPAKPWLGLPDQQQGADVSSLKKMVHNPDVTVRMRGVMEKCTYCVQRIVEARISAKNEHLEGKRGTDLVTEGELQTACQATCPTQAIVFGDLNDPDSEVSKLRKNARNYEMLEGQNLGARTTYLGKIRNRDI